MFDVQAKFKELPDFHMWVDGEGKTFLTSGGFHIRHLQWMSDLLDQHIKDYAKSAIVETGAGLSTALFLAKGFGSVTSIAPDLFLERNIIRWCAKNGISTEPLRFRMNRAEIELPRLVESLGIHERIDVALIDGDHGWPNVFVDFCYLNMALRTGGLIIFDDCNVYPVAECVNFLREEPGWEVVGSFSKMTAFRRKTAERFTSGAGRRYLVRKTKEMQNNTQDGQAS